MSTNFHTNKPAKIQTFRPYLTLDELIILQKLLSSYSQLPEPELEMIVGENPPQTKQSLQSLTKKLKKLLWDIDNDFVKPAMETKPKIISPEQSILSEFKSQEEFATLKAFLSTSKFSNLSITEKISVLELAEKRKDISPTDSAWLLTLQFENL